MYVKQGAKPLLEERGGKSTTPCKLRFIWTKEKSQLRLASSWDTKPQRILYITQEAVKPN